MYEVQQLIDGVWSAAGETGDLLVIDPADNTEVTRVPEATEAHVAAAVKASRVAAAGWAATPAAARGAALHRVADLLESSADQLAEAQTAEMGRPIGLSRGGVEAGVGTLRQYAELGPIHRGQALAGNPEAIDLMAVQPRGVVAALTPWNDPVAVSCGLLGAALVTGNTVVFKPSERSPVSGWLLARLFAAHLPAGVLSLLTGGARVGASLAAQEVDVVAHVGSTATGRSIAATCAGTGAKALLENGGSDPLIVDDNVDPRWAAEQAALGAFTNSGQLCVAVERIYVLRGSRTRSSTRWWRGRRRCGSDLDAIRVRRSVRWSTAGSGPRSTPRCGRRSRTGPGYAPAEVCRTGRGRSTRPPCWSTAPTRWRLCGRRPSARSPRYWW